MSQAIEMSTIGREELLREVVSRQVSLSLSCRLDNVWTTFRSRFLGFDRATGDVVVEYPAATERHLPEIVEGQMIGVSFRRAHKKCVFETSVGGRCFFSLRRGDDVPAIALLWPAAIYELQRRLYYRSPVPEGTTIPVKVRRSHAPQGARDADRDFQGPLQDISAGGLGLVLSWPDYPRWESNARILAELSVEPGQEPLRVEGLLTYLEPCQQEVRMGIQFIGLETDLESRPVLEQIIGLASRFHQCERDRLNATG
jgi:c-di-GMP-binding flagellar brake protein YcgR